jgi:lipopolysaccharide export system permease protein
LIFGSINRMIFAELVKVFVMSLIALTGMFLIAGFIQEATKSGMSPLQILMAIPLIIPNMFPYTIPATTLFATCVVYGRMSADNEVLVLRAAGVNIYHLLWPAIALGIMTTTITGGLYYDLIPRSQRMLREQLFRDAEAILYNAIKRDRGLNHSNMDFVMYVQGRDLLDVVVKKRKADRSGFELVARAQSARMRIRDVLDPPPVLAPVPKKKDDDPTAPQRTERKPSAVSGPRKEVVVSLKRCFVDTLQGGTAAELHDRDYASPLPDSLFGPDTGNRPSSMTWRELHQRRAEVADELAEEYAQWEWLKSKGAAMAPEGKTYAELAEIHRTAQQQHLERLMRVINTEMQVRPALAVSCLCFVLVGCPVGIRANRSDYLSIFMVCFLPTVFAYYPILLATLNMSKSGKAPPYLAWGANAAIFLSSWFLVWRLMKR